jgi:hypothetical protein
MPYSAAHRAVCENCCVCINCSAPCEQPTRLVMQVSVFCLGTYPFTDDVFRGNHANVVLQLLPLRVVMSYLVRYGLETHVRSASSVQTCMHAHSTTQARHSASSQNTDKRPQHQDHEWHDKVWVSIFHRVRNVQGTHRHAHNISVMCVVRRKYIYFHTELI